MPIDVICMCTAAGQIRPLRFRLEDEHRLIRVNIDEVIGTRDITYVGAEAKVYRCRAVIDQVPCVVELKYTIRSHSWCLITKVQ